ncbi:PilZ domain-containing protein [Sphingomonas ginsengisoli (ex An et al. 2013)]|nr:PilZ domain-containing protein [Sphingomonas ginsengisoli An et al. 2013]
MSAALELSGTSLGVKLRNLSAEGALVEGDKLPVEGAKVVFKRQDLSVAARVIWVRGGRAGLSFDFALTPETVLRHIPTPKPRVQPEFRRPGLTSRVSDLDREAAASWGYRPTFDRPGE